MLKTHNYFISVTTLSMTEGCPHMQKLDKPKWWETRNRPLNLALNQYRDASGFVREPTKTKQKRLVCGFSMLGPCRREEKGDISMLQGQHVSVTTRGERSRFLGSGPRACLVLPWNQTAWAKRFLEPACDSFGWRTKMVSAQATLYRPRRAKKVAWLGATLPEAFNCD